MMLESLFSKMGSLLGGELVERTEAEQRVIDDQTRHLSLYYVPTCPYCIRVVRVIRRLKLNIEHRNVKRMPRYREELIANGGRSMVPCVRIQEDEQNVRWMYESRDISQYLRDRFLYPPPTPRGLTPALEESNSLSVHLENPG